MKKLNLFLILTLVFAMFAVSGVALAEDFTIGQVSWDLGDIFFRADHDGTKHTLDILAEEEGYNYERFLRGSADAGEQISYLENMMSQNVDIAIFNPVDSQLIGPVQRLNNKNIPVITNNVPVLGGSHTFVAFDNIEAGETTAKQLIEIFKEKYGPEPEDWAEAGGVIIELTGDLSMQIALDRREGFHNVLAPIVEETEGLELVSVEGKFSPDLSVQRMTNLTTQYGDDIIGTYTHGDTMTIAGVWPALQAKGMAYTKDNPKHIPMVCIDGTPEALKMVRENKIDSITVQDAFGEGVVVAQLVNEILQNGTESIANVGDVVYEDSTPIIMQLHPEEFTEEEINNAKPVWEPVEVVEGRTPGGSWDGVWYKTNSTATVPFDYSADSKLLWGNFWPFLTDEKWPWE